MNGSEIMNWILFKNSTQLSQSLCQHQQIADQTPAQIEQKTAVKSDEIYTLTNL
jgi:hypothetical protein